MLRGSSDNVATDPVAAGTDVTLVDVQGGRLAVHRLAGSEDSPQTVLAAHGITANGLAMVAFARALPDGIRVLAPDLRGRAESREITGRWGIGVHARDLIAVADAFALETFTLLGHSMGAYVAATLADRYPARVDRLVLVDGGVGFPVPAGSDVDALLTAVIGPAMTRLSMTFGSREEYLAFMAQNPAVGSALADESPFAADLRGYMDHDVITNADGRFVSSCVLDAIRVDGGAVMTEPDVLAAVTRLTVPTTLLFAGRGMFDQTPGLYTADLLAAVDLPETLTVQEVPDCNHYSIMFDPRALREVVAAVTGGEVTAAVR
jgi:pimeloyl-ACP methyl ester carboxylesterase